MSDARAWANLFKELHESETLWGVLLKACTTETDEQQKQIDASIHKDPGAAGRKLPLTTRVGDDCVPTLVRPTAADA